MDTKRLFYSTTALLTSVGAAVLALMLMLGSETFAKQPVWHKCPLPPNARAISLEMQGASWHRAKRLSGIEDIKRWGRPCQAVRVPSLLVGDPDGPGALPQGVYQGLHQQPQPFIFVRTGEIVACEYVFVFLPEDSSEMEVEHTLTHEYLHVIFYRVLLLSEKFQEDYRAEDSERWVREKMHDTKWLRENGFLESRP